MIRIFFLKSINFHNHLYILTESARRLKRRDKMNMKETIYSSPPLHLAIPELSMNSTRRWISLTLIQTTTRTAARTAAVRWMTMMVLQVKMRSSSLERRTYQQGRNGQQMKLALHHQRHPVNQQVGIKLHLPPM